MNWNLAMDPNNQRSLTFRVGVKLDEFDHLGGQFFFLLKKRRKPWNGGDFWKIIKSSQQKIVTEREFWVELGWDFSGLLKLLSPENKQYEAPTIGICNSYGFKKEKSFPPIPHQQPKSADTWKKIWIIFKRWFASIFLGGASLGCLKRFALKTDRSTQVYCTHLSSTRRMWRGGV